MAQNWEEVLIHQSCALAQKYLNRLQKRAARNLMKFNKGKCKVLHLRGAVPVPTSLSWDHLTESSLADKDLGALVKPKLSMTKQTNAWAALESGTSRSSELSSPLLSTREAAFEVFGPVLIFPAQERHGHTEECPAKGH